MLLPNSSPCSVLLWLMVASSVEEEEEEEEEEAEVEAIMVKEAEVVGCTSLSSRTASSTSIGGWKRRGIGRDYCDDQ